LLFKAATGSGQATRVVGLRPVGEILQAETA
jgi:hypothetical protein